MRREESSRIQWLVACHRVTLDQARAGMPRSTLTRDYCSRRPAPRTATESRLARFGLPLGVVNSGLSSWGPKRFEILVQMHWRIPRRRGPSYSPRPPPSPAVNGGILFGFGAHITPTFAAHVVFCTKFRKHILTSLYRRRSWVRGRSRGRLNPLELVPRIKAWQNGNIQCVRDALRVN